MSYNAGDIEATATLDLTPFQRGLAQAKKDARSFERDGISIRVDADTSPATRSIDEWQKRQQSKGITVGVDVGLKQANTALNAWRTFQGHQNVKQQVEVDTSKASVAMATWRARQDGKTIHQRVEVDSSGLREADKALGGISTTVASLVPSLRSLGFASIGYAAASAVPAVGALGEAVINLSKGAFLLPGGISVAAASIGTLMLGMNGVTSAFKAASAASATAGKSAASQAAAQAKLDAALAKLAPSARDSVKAILGLKGAFDDMKLRVQQSLFAGLASEIKDLGGTYLPVLSGGMSQVASGFNSAIKQVSGFLRESQTVKDIGSLFSDTAQIVRNLSKAIKPVLDGLRDMGTVGVEYLQNVTSGAGGAAQKFADWARNMRQTGQFKHDLQEMGATLHNLVSTVVNVGGAFGALFSAMNATGSGTLNLLREVTGEFNQWAHSLSGQSTLIGFFTRLKEITDELKPAVKSVFDALGQAFQILAPVLPTIAKNFADIVQAIVPAIPSLAQLAADILPPLTDALAKLGPILPGIVASFIGFRLAVKGLLGLGALVGTVTRLAGAFRSVADAVGAVKVAGLAGGLNSLAGAGERVAAAAAGSGGAAAALRGVGTAAGGAAGSAGLAATAAGGLAAALGPAALVGAALAAAGGIAYLAVGAVKAAHSTQQLSDNQLAAADQVAHSATNYDDFNKKMVALAKSQSDVNSTTTAYGSSASDAATAGKAFADSGAKMVQVHHQQQDSLTQIASTLGISLPQALKVAQAANIKLRAGFQGSSTDATNNRKALDNLKKAGVGLDAQFKDLNQDVQTWTDKSSTAAQKANALADILGSKTAAGTKKADDATASFYQDMDTLGDSMNNAKGAALNASGGFDLTTEKGRTLRTAMQQAQTSMFNYATEAQKAGVPTATINQHLQDMRQRLIDTITPFVGSRDAAKRLADQLGLIPSKISIAIGVQGGAQAESAFDVLKGKIAAVTGTRTVVVNGLTHDAEQKLISLGFKVQHLPNGQVKITAPTDAAGKALDSFLGWVNTRTGWMHINGDISPGQQRLAALLSQANGSIAWAKLDADSDSGKVELAKFILKIQQSGGKVTVGGNTVPGNLDVNGLVNWINTHPHGRLGVDADLRTARNDVNNFIDQPRMITIGTRVVGLGPQGEMHGGPRGALGGIVTNNDIVHAAQGTVIPGYAPGKDVVPALLSPGEAVLTPELTRAVGPANILAANAAATLGRSLGGSQPAASPSVAPLTHNGAARTSYFEDQSARYADGFTFNPDTGTFQNPAVSATRQAAATKAAAAAGSASPAQIISATFTATPMAKGGVAGLAAAGGSSVTNSNVSSPTGTEQLSASAMKQTVTQVQQLHTAVQGLQGVWNKVSGVVTQTVVPAFTSAATSVGVQAATAVAGLAGLVPPLSTQFAVLSGTTNATWGAVTGSITGSHRAIEASQAGLQANQTGSWNAITARTVGADNAIAGRHAVLRGQTATNWAGITGAIVASDNAVSARHGLLASQTAGSWASMNTAVGTSVAGQIQAFGSLRQGMTQTSQAIGSLQSFANTQFGLIYGDAARPLHNVLVSPFNAGIIAAWNSVNSQFGLNKHVNPVAVPFATGGAVSGPGGPRSDQVPALLSNGEFVVNAHSAAATRPLLEAINAKRFADGGPVGNGVFAPIVGNAFTKVPGMINQVLAAFPGNLAAIDGGGVATKAMQGAQKALGKLIQSAMAKFGILANGAVVSAAVKAEQAYALSQFGHFGWGAGQMGPLIALWNRESGWNPTIANSSSGAYGIPQALPASKMASAGADWRTNPATQINWGLSYIAGRYHTPAGAWAHENAFGWYGDGLDGGVFTQPTLIGVGEKGPERVDVTPLRGGGEPGTVTLSSASIRELAAELRRAPNLTFEVHGATQDTVSDLVDEAMFKARHVGKSVYT